MPMNVKPIPTLDDRINDIRMRTAAIVNEEILPNEAVLWRAPAAGARTRRSARRPGRCASTSRTQVKAGGCGRRTCRRSTAAWASTSSPTPT